MKNRYIFFNIIVTLIALLLMFGLGVVVTRNNNIEQAKDEVIRITNIYASMYDSSKDYNISVDDEIRITIIDSTGVVLADSSTDSTLMDNHIDRDEIVSALKGNPSTFIRKSDTKNIEMIYYALKVDTSSTYVFIRVAMSVSSVTPYVMNTIPLMICILLCALLFSTFISYFFSNKIVKPLELVKNNLNNLNHGNYYFSLPNTNDADINRILVEINDLGEKLKNNLDSLEENKTKLDYIINNIPSAIVAFDINDEIMLMNSSAREAFHLSDYDNKSISYLSLDIDFINELKGKENKIFESNLNGKYYLCSLKKLDNDLHILMMNDITEAKCNEMIRSEFFANASHELKTPLTSIKGFNEMVMMNNKDHSLDKFIQNIEHESNRILALLDDMLKISKLESTKEIDYCSVDLNSVALEIKEELRPIYEARNINFIVNGKALILGEKEHFYEIIKNLAENAIKYNLDNGEVSVNLSDEDDKITILVIDNGIGIDEANQTRIFERFYRVNKSRSKSSGGTGLGLAIVKHIVNLYNGSISLSSGLGKGTSFKIVFNKINK